MNSYIRYLISAFSLLFLMIPALAQETEYDFYYYKGEKVPLQLHTETIFISATNAKDISSINLDGTQLTIQSASVIQEDKSSQILLTPENFQQAHAVRYWREIKFSETRGVSKEAYANKIAQIKANNKNIIVSPYFKKTESDNIGLSNYFYIKLRHQDDFELLLNEIKTYNLELVGYNKFMPLWFTISVTPASGNVLKMANTLYETNLFADIDPAFMFNFRGNCTNDTNFSQLWGLDNTTDPNIDINACAAWGITEGNGINVAVLDQGVFTTHNDLNANISATSFDTQSGTSPSVFTTGRDHGTHVSGTIAAEKDNNLQIVGVAPESSIMSISHTLSLTPNVSQELADGLNWAWQNGADVINNSWGDQGGAFYSQLQSAMLENAITNTLTMGRLGLGTVVVFAAGNQSPAIDYPASFHDDILVTGSITSTGQRSSFSGFGGDLDIVAPGSGILSTIPTNGIASWDGTSMAAPHTAGVAALVLEVNNGLSAIQVNDIIEQTAQKIRTDLYTYSSTVGRPNGNWNNQLGYGLIDAHAAVLLSQSMACPTNLFVNVDVLTGVDNKEASMTLTANNTIGASGQATYHAADEVFLQPGFDALNGSKFRAYLEGCTGTFVNRTQVPTQEIIQYRMPDGLFSKETEPNLANEIASDLKLFPNPTKGIVTIQFSNTVEKTIEIYTITGITVLTKKIEKESLRTLDIDLSRFQTGIYIVKITDIYGETSVSRIIKQ